MSPGPRRSRPLPAVIALAALGVPGCSQVPPVPPEEQTLEMVEVEADPYGEISTETDRRERRTEPRIAGVLPGDFPPDWPLPEPASVLDFGREPGGSWVLLQVPREVPELRSWILAAAGEAGWRREHAWEEGARFRQGGRSVEVTWKTVPGGAELRLGYR